MVPFEGRYVKRFSKTKDRRVGGEAYKRGYDCNQYLATFIGGSFYKQ